MLARGFHGEFPSAHRGAALKRRDFVVLAVCAVVLGLGAFS
jgi:energy-coupling factor transporter transmembrane protein EcfT